MSTPIYAREQLCLKISLGAEICNIMVLLPKSETEIVLAGIRALSGGCDIVNRNYF